MTFSELLAKSDAIARPLIAKMPGFYPVFLYSNARKFFLHRLSSEQRAERYSAPEKYKKKLWGIEFSSSLFNAAGMFKKGEAYYTVASQGAGAYLAGTTTRDRRGGNIKMAIQHPFAAYPKSKTASNWMGLPNEGHEKVARRLKNIDKIHGTPIGASIGLSPEAHGKEALDGALEGFDLYEKANVDFIELNESCPNVPHEGGIVTNELDGSLINHLEYISKKFLKKRKRNLPVVVKFSTDTNPELVPELLSLLLDLGYDGVNFGNTSTDYENASKYIHNDDKRLFDYFTNNFGGGISGVPLKEKSLALCRAAAEYLEVNKPSNEFGIIRTGGIETFEDLLESEKAGVSLNQWFTGYFEAFCKYGHNAYMEIFE